MTMKMITVRRGTNVINKIITTEICSFISAIHRAAKGLKNDNHDHLNALVSDLEYLMETLKDEVINMKAEDYIETCRVAFLNSKLFVTDVLENLEKKDLARMKGVLCESLDLIKIVFTETNGYSEKDAKKFSRSFKDMIKEENNRI